jgi:hypothetical protein
MIEAPGTRGRGLVLKFLNTGAENNHLNLCTANGSFVPQSRPPRTPQRMSASLIGYLGQALLPVCFGSLSLIRVTLLFAVWFDVRMASLQAYVGSAVESPAFRRASRYAADFFGFFHEPRPVRDDPVRIVGWRFSSCHASHLVLTEFCAIDPYAVH